MKNSKTIIIGVILFLVFILILPLYNNVPNVCMPCPADFDYCPPCGSTVQLEFFGLAKMVYGWIGGSSDFYFPSEPMYILWDSIGIIVAAFLLTWLILLMVKKITGQQKQSVPKQTDFK